jgi:hypothetical protein
MDRMKNYENSIPEVKEAIAIYWNEWLDNWATAMLSTYWSK